MSGMNISILGLNIMGNNLFVHLKMDATKMRNYGDE